MDITTKLQDFAFTFETLHELDSSGFDFEKAALVEFGFEFSPEFTDEQQDLYEVAFALMEMADEHFEPERREEEAGERRDEAAYLTSEGNH